MSQGNEADPFSWKVDECSVYFDRLHIRGWCFHSASPIERVEAVFSDSRNVMMASFGLPSPDVASGVDYRAVNNRFDEWIVLPEILLGRDFLLRLTLKNQTTFDSGSVIANASKGDPYFDCWNHFVEGLRTLESGSVLEIGSRARSAITYREVIPPQLSYVGMDILPGPNVDIVGDAHDLEKLFGQRKFVAAFSRSVFEHLAMPWKVAIELNRVLLPGAMVYSGTHQTWPLHEEPWDFWRFSRNSWKALFNESSGFELIETAYGEPARIHALRAHPATRSLPEFPAYLGSASIVRKIAETTLSWPVSITAASSDAYPTGELREPPR